MDPSVAAVDVSDEDPDMTSSALPFNNEAAAAAACIGRRGFPLAPRSPEKGGGGVDWIFMVALLDPPVAVVDTSDGNADMTSFRPPITKLLQLLLSVWAIKGFHKL